MRNLRFGMRTLFVAVTVAAVWHATYSSQGARQRAAVAEIKRLGGHVVYEASAYDAEPLRIMSWLTWALGPDWFHSVDSVHLPRATDRSIAVLQELPNMRKLTLRGAMISTDGVKQVAALSELESLQLHFGALSDVSIRSLSQLKRLRHLEVRGTSITDASMAVIGRLPSLRSLQLADCSVTERGLQAFRGSARIAWFAVSRPKFTDASSAMFPAMPNLRELHLAEATITDDGEPKFEILNLLQTQTSQPANASSLTTMVFPTSELSK